MDFEKGFTSGKITRREMLARMGTGLVAITVSSAWGQISPAEARAKGVALCNLSAAEGRTLEALGDILLPGAREAGIAHYVDDQLSRENPLFVLKYMDYVGSYTEFYKQGLQSLERLSLARHGEPFDMSTIEQKAMLVREISQKNPGGWSGPPAPLFYFVARNDAIDVYYGTPEGFEKLGIPYMAHIMPTQKW